MSSVCSGTRAGLTAALLLAFVMVPHASVSHQRPSQAAPLRVCADPNNLPFSNQHLDGFENRIAAVVGQDMGRSVSYYWMPQRRGFVRTTLNAGHCDLVIGLVDGYERVRTTRAYYRSAFVFVTGPGIEPVRTFDDPRLPGMRIGIQITGEDYENPPPAQALARRHLANQVRGFTVYGDYGKPDPQRAIIDAVATRQIDTAAVWGPLAGYFANREQPPLQVTAITGERTSIDPPVAFAIVMGVRKDDAALQRRLNRVLDRRQRDIDTILRAFHVPLLPLDPGTRGLKGLS